MAGVPPQQNRVGGVVGTSPVSPGEGAAGMAAASWREQLKVAVSISSDVDGASRGRARSALLQAVRAWRDAGGVQEGEGGPPPTVGAVVVAAGEYLSSDSNELRRRCCDLTADIVEVLDGSLTFDEAHHLAEFFASRLQDWPALRGPLRACTTLLGMRAADARTVGADAHGERLLGVRDAILIADSFADHVQCQSHSQPERALCFGLADALVHFPGVLASAGAKFIPALVASLDGEKDPRCLLTALRVMAYVPRAAMAECPATMEANAEEMADVLSCYFPMSFDDGSGGSKSDDGMVTSRDELRDALNAGLSSCDFFAKDVLPVVLEKLGSRMSQSKEDAMLALQACSSGYGADTVSQYATEIWQAIRTELCDAVSELETPGLKDTKGVEDEVKRAVACATAVGRKCAPFIDVVLADDMVTGLATVADATADGDERACRRDEARILVGTALLSGIALCGPQTCERALSIAVVPLVAGASSAGLQAVTEHKIMWCVSEFAARVLLPARDSLRNPDRTTASALRAMLAHFTAALTSLEATLPVDSIHMLSPGCSTKCLAITGLSIVYIESAFSEEERRDATRLLAESSASIGGLGDTTSEVRNLVRESANRSIRIAPVKNIIEDALPVWLPTAEDTHPSAHAVASVASVCLTPLSPSQKLPFELVRGTLESLRRTLVRCMTKSSAPDNVDQSVFICLLRTLRLSLPVAMRSVEMTRDQSGELQDDLHSLLAQDILLHAQAVDPRSAMIAHLGRTVTRLTALCDPAVQRKIGSTASVSFTGAKQRSCIATQSVVFSMLAGLSRDVVPSDISWLLNLSLEASVDCAGGVAYRAAVCAASLVNKHYTLCCGTGSDAVGDAIEKAVNTYLWPYLRPDAGAPDVAVSLAHTRRIRAIAALGLLLRALYMARAKPRHTDLYGRVLFEACIGAWIVHGVPAGTPGIDVQQRHERETRFAAGVAIGLVAGREDADLSPINGFVDNKFFRQKFYASHIKYVIEVLSDPEISENQSTGAYSALAYVVCGVPQSVVATDSNNVVPHLITGASTLSSDNAEAFAALMQTILFMADAEGSREKVSSNADTLVTMLCQILEAKCPDRTRMLALSALQRLADSMPHSSLYPHRMKVLGVLTRCLDDDKRAARIEAATCRTVWLSKFAPMGKIIAGD